jgi:UDP-glucose:(heptosyl)LPS alpha-1,3-glucosyltransferase
VNIGLVRRGFSQTGGAENYVKRLGRALADAGHQATLYSTADWPAAEWLYGKLIRVRASSPYRFASAVQACRQPDETLYSLERILQCDCYRAGDGVHKLWLERRVAHEPGWRKFFRFLNRKHAELLGLERTMFEQRGARHVIANSRMVQNEIIRTFGYPAEKITVVYNGLPATHFKKRPQARTEMRQRWGLRDKIVAILFAGSGWDRKGLKYAVRAVNAIADANAQLIVAGKGKTHGYTSGKVRFLGPVSDMQSLLMAVDLFVLPTVYDPFSNACLEALSYGLPVITTATNGFAEIIEPGVHGAVIDRADDIPALRHALEEWLPPARRESARGQCSEVARRYSMNTNVEQTLRVLETLR